MKQQLEELLDTLIIVHRIEIPESKCIRPVRKRISLFLKKSSLELRKSLRRFFGRVKK